MGDTIQTLNEIIELYKLADHSESLRSSGKSGISTQMDQKVQLLKSNLNAILFEYPNSSNNIILYLQETIHAFVNILETEKHLNSEKTIIFQSAVNQILTHFLVYFRIYIDSEKILPKSFVEFYLGKNQVSIELQISKLEHSNIDGNIISSLIDYLNIFRSHHFISLKYNDLYSLEEMLLMLSSIDFKKRELEKPLTIQLLKFNFNHLLFFRYLQSKIKDELAQMTSAVQKEEFLKWKRIEIPDLKYKHTFYKEWPPIQHMLKQWINDEIAILSVAKPQIQKDIQKCDLEKVCLDISVAQLACIIKCFYEEVTHYSVSVKSILQLFTQKVTTKRQTEISYKSLSKCYYAVDQSTAASVLALFEKMTIKIKKSYFN